MTSPPLNPRQANDNSPPTMNWKMRIMVVLTLISLVALLLYVAGVPPVLGDR